MATSNGQRLLRIAEPRWLIATAVAVGLLVGAIFLPLWKMKLIAPQYPDGLMMYAYGTKFVDSSASDNYDEVREINELNHYIGMKAIENVVEMKLFIPGAIALAGAAALVSFVSWRRSWLRALVIAGFWTFPLFFIADLQYHLYDYGHTMQKDAPLKLEPFTPKVYGETKVWNFHSDNSFEIGFYLLVAAALTISLVPLLPRFVRWIQAGQPGQPAKTRGGRISTAPQVRSAIALAALGLGIALALGGEVRPVAAQATTETLQQQVDQASPGDTITVEGGRFNERIKIDKPLTLIGHSNPVIDGGGHGDVVTITADDVYISGFVIRGAGQAMSQEPAAIKLDGTMGVTLEWNRVEDSRFGIYLLNTHEALIEHNTIDLGSRTPIERRGHAIYMWQSGHSALRYNTIRNSADGIHLEFSFTNVISDNSVTSSRYALHFMYANENKVLRNSFHDNLAGAVLMFSKELIVKDNELSSNRAGATGAGMLLKDVDNVFVESNRFERNKYGVTAEGTPQSAGSSATFYHNLFALNDTGLALMSNAPITFIENSMIENTVQVKALGGAITSMAGHEVRPPTDPGAAPSHEHGQTPTASSPGGTLLPRGAIWSADGRGNYWSDYRGYDSDGNGVGDKPYQAQPPFAGRLSGDDGLRLFNFTLAQQAIDTAADMFPLYGYQAVIEDESPLMRPTVGMAKAAESGLNSGVLIVSVILLAAAAATMVMVMRPAGLLVERRIAAPPASTVGEVGI